MEIVLFFVPLVKKDANKYLGLPSFWGRYRVDTQFSTAKVLSNMQEWKMKLLSQPEESSWLKQLSICNGWYVSGICFPSADFIIAGVDRFLGFRRAWFREGISRDKNYLDQSEYWLWTRKLVILRENGRQDVFFLCFLENKLFLFSTIMSQKNSWIR